VIASDRWVRQAGEFVIGQLGLEEFVARGDAAAFHVGAVVGGHPGEIRGGGGIRQVAS